MNIKVKKLSVLLLLVVFVFSCASCNLLEDGKPESELFIEEVDALEDISIEYGTEVSEVIDKLNEERDEVNVELSDGTEVTTEVFWEEEGADEDFNSESPGNYEFEGSAKYYDLSVDVIISVILEEDAPSENIKWESSGHEPIVFEGLFTNPDYSDKSIFLKEDGLTKITPQVKDVSELINDNKDINTLEEIFSLLRAIETEDRPRNTFEVSATKILSTPITGGCTTYATAFATLARAKGIPTVVIDSASLEWIEEGCSLDFVKGHFFVEVYIEEEWFLIDSTSGTLYENYDRGNWFLPKNFIAFTKSLSVIDTGATEESHNLLQRVAFIKKDNIDYSEPNYPQKNLYNDDVSEELKEEYNELNLEADEDYTIDTSGDKFEIEASSEEIDFKNILY